MLLLSLLVATSLLSAASRERSTAQEKPERTIEFFNQQNCKFILASAVFGPDADESKDKCENILSQNGHFVNYWVKSVRINGHCNNVQAYDTLSKSCLRFQ